MKYKLIKTTVNVKTHAICQTIDICNGEEELRNYWKNVSSNNMFCGSVGNSIGDVDYFIQSGKIKDSDYIVTIMQYTLNYLV